MVRGYWDLYTQSEGWIAIELGDPATMDYTPIEVRTPSGWAAPRVVPTGDADTPLEVYTQSNGWMGIARDLAQIIDDFESGGVAAYTNRSDTGSHSVNTSAARSGTYGYESQGEEAIWSVPGSGLDHYPETGKTFEFYFNLLSFEQLWILFGGTTDADQDRYQVEFIADNDFRIRVDNGGSRTVLAYAGQGAVDFSLAGWYRCEVQWHSGGGMTVILVTPNGTTHTLDTADATFTGQGKIGYRTSGNCHAYIDDVAMVL